jgi:hypothetical protein
VVETTGNLWVKKVVVGDPADSTSFTVSVSGLGSGLSFSQPSPRSFIGVALGSYTVTEGTPPAGYSLVGYAVVGAGDATCPASATSSGTSVNVTLTSGAPNATVCVYNERVSTPTPTPTTPAPTSTPTPTATTPAPTSTPTPTPTTPAPTSTPTPTETVAGEATPGPTATPVVPRAGTGTSGGAGSAAAAALLLGLALAATGAAVLRMRAPR